MYIKHTHAHTNKKFCPFFQISNTARSPITFIYEFLSSFVTVGGFPIIIAQSKHEIYSSGSSSFTFFFFVHCYVCKILYHFSYYLFFAFQNNFYIRHLLVIFSQFNNILYQKSHSRLNFFLIIF